MVAPRAQGNTDPFVDNLCITCSVFYLLGEGNEYFICLLFLSC